MAENSVVGLTEITAREAAEFEKMSEILARKRDAIARLDTNVIREILNEEITTMKMVKELERERFSVLQSLSLSGVDLNEPSSLERVLGKEGAEGYMKVHAKFRSIFETVQRLNGTCRFLLVNSLAFIRQNIRILTDDGNRKLVDKRA